MREPWRTHTCRAGSFHYLKAKLHFKRGKEGDFSLVAVPEESALLLAARTLRSDLVNLVAKAQGRTPDAARVLEKWSRHVDLSADPLLLEQTLEALMHIKDMSNATADKLLGILFSCGGWPLAKVLLRRAPLPKPGTSRPFIDINTLTHLIASAPTRVPRSLAGQPAQCLSVA